MARPIARTLTAMSYVLTPSPDPPPQGDGRALAMLNYGLMFASIFFAGIPLVIAAAIAYSQKNKVPALARSHFRAQIGLFWTTFTLALLAGAMALSGLFMALAELLLVGGQVWDAGWQFWELKINGGAIALLIGGLVVGIIDAALLMIVSAIGFIKLASTPTLGKSAA